MRHWKAILGVIAVFLLGMLAGGLVTVRVVGHRFRHGSDFLVRRLSWQLHLDSTQREQLRGIVTDAQQQLRNVHRQVQPQVEAILAQSDDKVRAMLQPDQLKTFDRIVADRKARRARALPPSPSPSPPQN
jgi:uncharacterized membrane protein